MSIFPITHPSSYTMMVLSIAANTTDQIVRKLQQLIHNRGGLAYLIGFMIVRAQFKRHKLAHSARIVLQFPKDRIQVKRIKIDESHHLNFMIYYPKDWKQEEAPSRCLLYHNPRDSLIADYLNVETKTLRGVPEKLQTLARCPIVLYDYRGVGLNAYNDDQVHSEYRRSRFFPTYESIIVDGVHALKAALALFNHVDIAGTSLGGAVATIALHRCLKQHPNVKEHVTLLNHSSFSTTPKVITPKLPNTANLVGWIIGGLVDAEQPMKSLIGNQIPVTILCHQNDPVVPSGARMSDYIKTLPPSNNVFIIETQEKRHVFLSDEMMDALKKTWPQMTK